jgi:hypothetical protein
MESSTISATTEHIIRHNAGAVLAVAFAGKYPAGSAGNQCAAEMVDYLRSVLTTTDAAAVLFDLRNLEYTWGDASGGLAWALQKQAAVYRSSAIVANGRTLRALAPLLGPQVSFGVVGTKMFGSMPEAIDHLERVLAQETG